MQGLALEGGGAKGAYHIGAYKALIKNGYNFKAIAGASIGAVNAAIICQGDFEQLEKIWYEIDASIFDLTPEVVEAIVNRKIRKDIVKTGLTNIKDVLKKKGLDTTKFMNLLDKYIDEKRVRESSIKFGLVTMCLTNFKPLELTIDEIPEGKLNEYIMASCYLPVFNMKRIIDDKFYLDGGFTNVLPITLLERMGCDDIVGVRVKKFGLIKKKRNPETKVLLIKPKKNIGSVILINRDRSIHNAKLGYYDTLRIIRDLDGNVYYIKKRSKRFYRYIARGYKKEELAKLLKKYRVKDVRELTLKLMENIMIENNFELFTCYEPWVIIKKIKHKYIISKDSVALSYIQKLKSY